MAKTPPKEAAKPAPSVGTRMHNYIAAVREKRAIRFIVLWFVAYGVLISVFCSTLLKDYNYIEVFPRELIFPSALHAVTALLITMAVYWLPWLRTFAAKLTSTLLLALFMTSYDNNFMVVSGIVRAFTPGLSETDPLALISVAYLLTLAGLAALAGIGVQRLLTKTKLIQSKDAAFGVLILAACLSVMPVLSVARILPSIIQEARVQAPELNSAKRPAKASSSLQDKPDIYYIVLDRYTNADVLKQQFSFDNSAFTGFLKDSGFHVNDHAYSNYPYTAMSVASTLTADYTAPFVKPFKDSSVQSRTLYHNLIWQSNVVKALKKEGYRYHNIGSWYGATYKAPLAERDYMADHMLSVFGRQKRLRGIEASQFMTSPYYRFTQLPAVSWWPFKTIDQEQVANVRQQLQILNDLSTKEQPGGRLIFAHILVPHEPFLFNADGSLALSPESNSHGKPIKQKYTAQVQFINAHIKELTANIHQQSKGQAVVLLNSDEGPYPQIMNDTFKQPTPLNSVLTDGVFKDDMRTWEKDRLKMKFGTLQAVHIPRATPDDLAHMSNVNLFRVVLNRYAGYNLDYLPDCHFGVTAGSHKEFNYADITGKLTAQPDKSCRELQSLPRK